MKPEEYIECPECGGYAGYDCEYREGRGYRCEECGEVTVVPPLPEEGGAG